MVITSGGGQVAEDEGVLHIRHDDIISFRYFNLSQKPVYLTVFDLTSLLRIYNVFKKKYKDFKDV